MKESGQAMIKIEMVAIDGWKAAIRGMRNPMNSWNKSDSVIDDIGLVEIGQKDFELMHSLILAGTDHRKFLRMINVTCDITAPLYWWKEFDTYKVGTVSNSCSTMHKITAKEFVLDDFSHEHLGSNGEIVLQDIIDNLNYYRNKFIQTKDKFFWWNIIQLLPSSYNQKRTVQMNYEVLNNIYHSRRNHKLDEWRIGFCDFIKSLPYANILII